MRDSAFLTQPEKQVIEDMDRMINYAELYDEKIPEIVLSDRQTKAFKRVWEKVKRYGRAHELYSHRCGELQVSWYQDSLA